MSEHYRVLDLSATEQPEQTVQARSPEAAASQVLGMEVVRSGAKRDLMARVYWQVAGRPLNMVRLYRRVDWSLNGRPPSSNSGHHTG